MAAWLTDPTVAILRVPAAVPLLVQSASPRKNQRRSRSQTKLWSCPAEGSKRLTGRVPAGVPSLVQSPGLAASVPTKKIRRAAAIATFPPGLGVPGKARVPGRVPSVTCNRQCPWVSQVRRKSSSPVAATVSIELGLARSRTVPADVPSLLQTPRLGSDAKNTARWPTRTNPSEDEPTLWNVGSTSATR